MSEFIALALAAFNVSLGLHFMASNITLSLAIAIFSILVGIAIIWKFEGNEKLENKQLDVAICLLLSLLGGLSAWLI